MYLQTNNPDRLKRWDTLISITPEEIIMTIVKARDLGKPPGVCESCWATDQKHHPADDGGGEAFYCSHHRVLAIVKSDYSGWFVESHLSREEYDRRCELAAQGVAAIKARTNALN